MVEKTTLVRKINSAEYCGMFLHKKRKKSNREVLEAALEQVIANAGEPGIGGQRQERLREREEGNELNQRWLAELQTQLRNTTCRPSPLRRGSESRTMAVGKTPKSEYDMPMSTPVNN